MAPPRALILTLVVAFIGYVTWGVMNAGDDSAPPPQQVPLVINGGSAAGHRMTTPSWTILYDHIEASTDSNLINARGIRDAVIFRKGKPYIHLKADHVEANLANKDFTATGHIHAEQRSNGVVKTFETGTATWTEQSQKLIMPNQIRLKMQQIAIDVRSLVFDVRTGAIKVGSMNAKMHM